MAAPQPLLLAGAGGFARETAEVVHAVNAHSATAPRWRLLGFLDDAEDRWGTEVSGLPVVGPLDALADHPDAAVAVCTGHPGDFSSRRRIVERLGLPAERFATLVHPAAHLGRSCTVGAGTVVLAGVVATVDVAVGAHVGLMPHVVLTHDDAVGDFAILGAGARLAGAVTVEAGAYLGSGCLIRERLRVGAGALVGMGAVVTRDVPPGEVWTGAPARFLRRAG